MELGNRTRTTALTLLEMEPSMMNLTDDDDTILTKIEFFVFRGTDGLPFNILQLTKDYQ